jgi:N utilization substance protein B
VKHDKQAGSKMTSITRRFSREVAFQFLFSELPAENQITATRKPVVLLKSNFESFCKNFQYSTDDYAWELVFEVGKNLPMLDGQIKTLSTNWRIERMPRVDLTILRMCAHEILNRPDIPRNVSIFEAVELAKRFGAEDSPAFVNGLLDKIPSTKA